MGPFFACPLIQGHGLCLSVPQISLLCLHLECKVSLFICSSDTVSQSHPGTLSQSPLLSLGLWVMFSLRYYVQLVR